MKVGPFTVRTQSRKREVESTVPGNMATPLVTIITPTLNRANFLRAAIESVALQTYNRIQHIIVDGGSNDRTMELLAQLGQTFAFEWISEPDEGMYEALNKGLARARGEIVGYLNSDDEYLPYSVEVAVRRLVERPDLAFVYGDVLTLDAETLQGSVWFYPPFSRKRLFRGALISQPTVFARKRSLMLAGCFDPTFKLAGDFDCWSRIARVGEAEHIDEVLAVEWEHSDRLSTLTSQGPRRRSERMRIIEANLQTTSRLRQCQDHVYGFLMYRRSGLLFLMQLGTSKARGAGHHWGGFLGGAAHYRVSSMKLFVALIPLLGRFFKTFVRVRNPRSLG